MGTYTRTHRTYFGDMKVHFYTVANYTNAETLTVSGMRQIKMVVPTCATADKAISYTLSANVITFATGADTYDGYMMVIGK